MLRVGLTRRRPRGHTRQTHLAHQPLHTLAINAPAATTQKHHHAPRAVERAMRVFLVDQRAQLQVFLVLAGLPQCRVQSSVHRGAWHGRQFTLARQRQTGITVLDPGQALLLAYPPTFF